MGSGRVIGFTLIVAGGAVGLVGALWLSTSVAGGRLQVTGAVLGAGLLVVIILPLIGAGVFLLVRSRREALADAERASLRRILDLVKSRGQIPVSDIVLELGSSREEVQRQVHAIVGMGLFSGYINWDDGVLFSAEAAGLRSLDRCKYCGGELKLAGKGVVACPYCGAEYFLS